MQKCLDVELFEKGYLKGSRRCCSSIISTRQTGEEGLCIDRYRGRMQNNDKLIGAS